MIITLKKEKILNSDKRNGFLAAILITIVFTYYYRSNFTLIVGFALLALIFLPVSLNRYLKIINFDFDSKNITTKSILGIPNKIPFDRLISIHTTKSTSLDFSKGYNFVIRKKGNFQPLLFEVNTKKEEKDIETLFEKLKEEGLFNKKA